MSTLNVVLIILCSTLGAWALLMLIGGMIVGTHILWDALRFMWSDFKVRRDIKRWHKKHGKR